MGLIAWLVSIGCLLIGAAIGILGLTEFNRSIVIWGIGIPGAMCLVIAAGFEFQGIVVREPDIDKRGEQSPRAEIQLLYFYTRPMQDPGKALAGWGFQVVFKNVGNATATQTKIAFGYMLSPGDITGDIKLPPPQFDGAAEVSVARDVEFRSDFHKFVMPVFEAIERRTQTLLLFGEVRYVTDNKSQPLPFCAKVLIDKDFRIAHPEGPNQGPFNFTACPNHK